MKEVKSGINVQAMKMQLCSPTVPSRASCGLSWPPPPADAATPSAVRGGRGEESGQVRSNMMHIPYSAHLLGIWEGDAVDTLQGLGLRVALPVGG